ncbi:MYCBP-associated protein-like isoform X2 [Polyodon spathula]|uniref:MYCBP-associated protein-like isoform X2 n=1 Tax=Polyodon spathula TaxID=7913 RepID=UPI001B7DD439|nr:MYCBP-associated protein-like isoform X2 [Polyodon spathula]
MATSNKATAKTGKRDARPKTPPEKRSKASDESPPVSEEQPKSPTLKGDDIQALAIKVEDLEKLHIPHPPKDSQKLAAVTRLLVRKIKPKEDERRKIHLVVARPAPADAAVQPVSYARRSGSRFEANGKILPHSILGSLADFKKEVVSRGDTELAELIPDPPDPRSRVLTVGAYGKQSKALARGQPNISISQTHALQNWQQHMAERKRQQGFISSQLQKPVEKLVMNESDNFRQTQEQRHIIDHSLPALHYRKGYRGGSEFWNQPQRIGDELTGLTITLTQTEQGYPEPVTHIGQPRSIRLETGTILPENMDPSRRLWDKSLYLLQRREELKSVLKDLDFNQPDIEGLEVIGTGQPFTSVSVEHYLIEEDKESGMDEKENHDPLEEYPDVMMEATLVPSINFCGQPAQWIGTTDSHKGEVGIAARLTFEAFVDDRATSHLDVTNDGSTAVYYSWKRLPHPPSFKEIQRERHMQRFYFNTSGGVILPGDVQRFLFTFKSGIAGIFSESWELCTHPVLLGGASMEVTLRGVAIYEDKLVEVRQSIQRKLEAKKALATVKQIVERLVAGVRTPERPCSPVDSYITQEEIFQRRNLTLYYEHSTVESLKQLWNQYLGSPAEPLTGETLTAKRVTPTESQLDNIDTSADSDRPVWDLSISSLRESVLSLPEEDEEGRMCREEALSMFNSHFLKLCSNQYQPQRDLLYQIGLQLWRETVDRMVSHSMLLRSILGMPEKEVMGEYHQESSVAVGKEKKEEKVDKKGDEKKSGKEDKKGTAKQSGKDKLTEERPASKKGKVKEEKKTGKSPVPVIKLTSSSESFESEPPVSHQEPEDPVLQDKYRKKLAIEVFELLSSMVENMSELFEEAKRSKNALKGASFEI